MHRNSVVSLFLGGLFAVSVFSAAAPLCRSEEDTWWWEFMSIPGMYPPCEGIIAGVDTADKPLRDPVLLVGLAFYGGGAYPGAVIPPYASLFSVDDVVHLSYEYFVMCGTGVAWQQVNITAEDGKIPATAIEAGKVGEDILYGCRVVAAKPYYVDISGYVDPNTLECVVPIRESSSGLSYTTTLRKLTYDVLIQVPVN